MSRFVVDANIVLAALAGRAGAPPALLLTAVQTGDLQAVACPALIAEIRENVQKPYFLERIKPQESTEVIDAYEAICVMLVDPDNVKPVLRDPADDFLVALAVQSGAQAIITGEYRIFIQIPGLPFADEPSWERLIGWLESNHADMGPVISWDDSATARITAATDAADAAGAAELASGAVARALHASGLGALYPNAIEIEPVRAKEPVAA